MRHYTLFFILAFDYITSFSGDDVGGAIPDPIPNSEVKPSRADGTARARAWESRSLPGLFLKAPKLSCFGAFSFPSAPQTGSRLHLGLSYADAMLDGLRASLSQCIRCQVFENA